MRFLLLYVLKTHNKKSKKRPVHKSVYNKNIKNTIRLNEEQYELFYYIINKYK